jgi:quinolinate synthase
MLQTILPDRFSQLTDTETGARIAELKARLGERLVILGHHYQRDDVIRFADFRGDSFKLAQLAAGRKTAEYIVFCGVHFMAESADILSAAHQKVILPDMSAGCSMADMAEIDQVETCWEELTRLTRMAASTSERIIPITYMNSTAAIKAFCGRHGGAVCTSSNAGAIVRWALERSDRILFLPDQHLGRNTAYGLGFRLDEMTVWDPCEELGGSSEEVLRDSRFILWKGHCSVHQRFLPEHVSQVRARYPGITVISHPECRWEVAQLSDHVGSTEHIIKHVTNAPAGSRWAVGTEIHLVNRLKNENPDKFVVPLDDCGCLCSTMFRIDAPHLLWALENLAEGRVVNQISVSPDAAADAHVALQRMLDITN